MSLRSLQGLTLALLAVTVSVASFDSGSSSPTTSESRIPPDLLPEISAEQARIAEALRQGQAAAARAAIDEATAHPLPADRNETLIEGLWAWMTHEPDIARELLQSAPAGADPFADVRLFVLADIERTSGDPILADELLERLVADHPGSSFRSAAMERAIELALDNQRWATASRWLDRARVEAPNADRGQAIEELALQIGERSGNRELALGAARRLLVGYPTRARELGLDDLLVSDAASLPPAVLLSPSEIEQRSRALLLANEAERALAILDTLPPDQRGTTWNLLRSEALIRDHRGVDALEALNSLDSGSGNERVEMLRLRGLAALDASKVRRGRANLPQGDREEMQQRALSAFAEMARVAAEPTLVYWALTQQFELLAELEDSFDRAMPILIRLQALEPDDKTGARYLWRLGWQSFSRRNPSGAIGYWSELEAVYPGSSWARSGRYWTGRAHELLGNDQRAVTIYREIAGSATRDFYSRHALARLDHNVAIAGIEPAHPREPWPEDPSLARALWLSDLGLDELASIELQGFTERAEPRAFALSQALILARSGQRRDSIRALVRAFPALGTPQQLTVPDPALEMYYPLDYRPIVEEHARQKGLSEFLVFAMIRQESAFDAQAISRAGARGLMQLMPATGHELAQRLGLRYEPTRLQDPEFSVRLGTAYFRQVLDMFDGETELALAGYNGGPYRIKKLWRQAGPSAELDRFLEGLALEETKTYVKRIVLFENSYRRLYASSG